MPITSFEAKPQRGKFSLAGEVINFPSSHKTLFVSNPSFHGKNRPFRRKGKAIPQRENSRTSTGSPPKCLMQRNSPVQMSLLIFPATSYGPGGPNILEKMPSRRHRRLNFPEFVCQRETLPLVDNSPNFQLEGKFASKDVYRALQNFRCKIPWPLFSRKHPALTSINRRKSAINPEIASINVCWGPILCDFHSFFCGNPHCPPSNRHLQYGLFGTIPG